MPKLKALGTRHCFNRIADSKHYLLSTKELNKVIALDTKAQTVTVEGGIKYGELAPYLHEKGLCIAQSGFVAPYFGGRFYYYGYAWFRGKQWQPGYLGSGFRNGCCRW